MHYLPHVASFTGDKIEKNEMGGTCSTYGGQERRIHGLMGKPKGKNQLGDLDVDGRIIFRWK